MTNLKRLFKRYIVIGWANHDVTYYVSGEDPCLNASCSHTCVILSANSYQCECPVGYKMKDGDNQKCQNIDECEDESDVCDQECTDTDGSYQCSCRPGYKEVNQVDCEDIDECTISDHDCEQVCENTMGSFLCSCNDTYRLGPDGKHCSCEEGYDRTVGECAGQCVYIVWVYKTLY